MSDETPALEGEIVNVPTSYNLTTTAKLIEAFGNRFNITEACSYAGISRVTYYEWLEKFPDLAEKIEAAKLVPNRRAKEVVTKAINEGDVTTARWVLDRTDKDFKPKGEMDVHADVVASDKKIKEFLDEPNDGTYDDVSTEPDTSHEPEAAAEVAATTPDIS